MVAGTGLTASKSTLGHWASGNVELCNNIIEGRVELLEYSHITVTHCQRYVNTIWQEDVGGDSGTT